MNRHIIGYYGFGGGTLDGEALENALNTSGALDVASVPYASSGGGVIFSGEDGVTVSAGVETIIDQDAGGKYDTAVGLGYGLLNAGYTFRVGPLRITPLLGIGGGGIGLDLTPSADANTDSFRLSRTNFLLHIGVTVELHIGGRLGMTVGGRAGYVFAPFSRRQGIRGPYAGALFGGRLRLPSSGG